GLKSMAQIQVQGPVATGGNGVAATVAVAAAVAVAGGGGGGYGTTSLYVGDLEYGVTDSQLYDLFNQVGQVVTVRVCRDMSSRRSLGYGYVNYTNANDAARAISILNFTPVNGKSIRIMYSHRDPSIRKSGTANIFIKNLDKTIDNKALHDTFSSFGNILSCKIATDSSGQSKGYGFQERDSSSTSKFNNVYVKNLPESTTDEDLKKTFGEYGTITSAVIMRDGDGKSKCFGFVNFENADDAAKAVEALNGKKIDDKEWYVGKAQKKSERELELKSRFEQSAKEAAEKYQGANLYVKNLDDTIDDDKLKKLFSEYGTITSCKVMLDPNGNSRGSGFVAFSTPEEASQAIQSIPSISLDCGLRVVNNEFYNNKIRAIPPTDWELYSGFRSFDEWMDSTTWGKRSPSLFKNLQQTGSIQDYQVIGVDECENGVKIQETSDVGVHEPMNVVYEDGVDIQEKIDVGELKDNSSTLR
ncbi:hypothetical protein M8C21_027307, partial [Ambrosia artemisiifolia]